MESPATQTSTPQPSEQSDRQAPAQTPDLRLVVCDMDGTLLDGHGEIPDGLWPILQVMADRGIAFTPASGRQYATLHAMFGGAAGSSQMAYIAENGALLMREGSRLDASVIDPGYVCATLAELDRLESQGHDIGAVLCGVQGAYIRRDDDPFLAEVSKYYLHHQVVGDLSRVDDDIIKIAVFDFGDAAKIFPRMQDAIGGESARPPQGTRTDQQSQDHTVVLSAHHWLDVSNADATKGHALGQLQKVLGVTPGQTAVFGDYLNDLDMFDHAELSFAMANSHPDLLARARFIAPSNLECGVVTTLQRLLGVHQ